MSERVLVVPRSLLFEGGRKAVDGFEPGDAGGYLATVARVGRFVSRALAEEDPSLKQIIPYGMLVFADKVFVMERTGKGGEARLHRKVSLGVGGHVNPEDMGPRGDRPADGRAAVKNAFNREIREELLLDTPYREEVVGVINDDSNSVGSVHFGIVYRLEVESPRVRVREEELLQGAFVPLRELGRYREAMETWSRIILDALWPEH